jgi:hypothetical protein
LNHFTVPVAILTHSIIIKKNKTPPGGCGADLTSEQEKPDQPRRKRHRYKG